MPLVASRPARFFVPGNANLPDVVQLGFRRAPVFERLSHDQYAKLVREHVDIAVAKAAEERREKGIQLVGRKAPPGDWGRSRALQHRWGRTQQATGTPPSPSLSRAKGLHAMRGQTSFPSRVVSR